MATYTYRCAADGPVDVRRPIGTAPASVACPACGAPAPRMITPPLLGLADRGRMAAIDRSERSRTEPDVVTSIPGSGRPARPAPRLDPRTRGLPRP
ncbi:putative regulatory protein, FmdB family [Pseudonocardia ammonioxydans]|uniref:Putative regulatory protein, FmdB family n=1 Tax=Pseudonocardia ammonioxydans TaxID=260086 RepID=A0A1I4WYZ7_PSUAM|nr:zinc ribbon domain-containing protein [Pseudonocardia ammonioxydans]SFN18350.1 putative regulatory protein, FmdB family [Pseudonocardia ammonioxydans]